MCVVILGAFVRLSDAGLGCPDWPGCYGHLVGIPETSQEIAAANQNFPQKTFVQDKAWKEMIHRYLAAGFGFMVLVLALIAWRNRRNQEQTVILPIVVLILVILQGLLGMWTVTLKLNPVVVLMHLAGGITIMALLWWLILQTHFRPFSDWKMARSGCRLLAKVAVCVVAIQILLGGWTSANYAALACTDFPTCQQQLWPSTDFGSVLPEDLWAPIDYEYGVLDSTARVTIHMLHRVGALFVLIVLSAFFYVLMRQKPPTQLVVVVAISATLLLVQITLGILNILLSLPIAVATAHNGVAVLLLLSLLTIVYQLNNRQLSTKTEDA